MDSHLGIAGFQLSLMASGKACG